MDHYDFSGDAFKNWKDKSNKELESKGYPGKIYDNSEITQIKINTALLSVLIFLGILSISGVILYLGFNDKFKSIDNSICNATATSQSNCPEITIPDCSCNCDPSFSCMFNQTVNYNPRNLTNST